MEKTKNEDKENQKTKKKRLGYPFLIILTLINSILGIASGIRFMEYMSTSQEELYEKAVQGIIDNSVDMSGQVDWFVSMQQGLLENTAMYIEGSMSDFEEALSYIEMMENISGKLAIIEFDTYVGEEVIIEEDGNAYRREVDYFNNMAVRKSCNKIKNGFVSSGGISATEIYSGIYKSEINDNLFSLVEPITIEGTDKVLLYTIPVAKIFEESLKLYDIENDSWVVMDPKGNMLVGKLPKLDNKEYTNYYDFIAANFGRDDEITVREALENVQNNNFILENNSGDEYIFVYKEIQGLEGWNYIYTTPRESLYVASEAIHIGEIVVLLTIIPWIINLAIIHHQNYDLRRNLKDMERQNNELNAADRAKTAFISNMSHEIRTPINAVLGLDEMIMVESNEKTIVEYAEGIRNAGKTLLGIINDILDYSKVSTGKMDIIPQEYDLGSAVNDLLNMIELKAKGKGLRMEVNINSEIPRILYGDDLRVKQIILNILSNAIKYTEKGSITLELDYRKTDDKKIMLLVKVSDTGIGMRKEEMEKLARPFQRLDEEKNRTVEGTGLGMSIVVSLLKQMGTKLEVESEYGKGSTFSFELEQSVVDWEKLGDFNGRYHNVKKENLAGDCELYAPKAKVLVVDDTDVNLKVVKGLLRGTGIRIDTALSGEECLKMAKRTKYHAILLDHRMPGMDGIETLHHLQEGDTENKDVPIIALTANVVSGAKESYLKEGFTDFLSKPVSGASLKKMLLKYLPSDILEEKAPKKEAVAEDGQGAPKTDGNKNPMLRHIDITEGIAACGSEELYKEVAAEFADTAENGSYEIQTFFEQQDYENYTIKVHALKSSARLVGATELSSEAAYLEHCGNYGDIKEIVSKTEPLLAHYIEVADEIKRMLSENSAQKKKELKRSEFKEMLVALSGFNEAFDYDRVDEIMKMLSEYEIPSSLKEVYEELKRHVYNVDQENIRLTVRKFIGGHKNE